MAWADHGTLIMTVLTRPRCPGSPETGVRDLPTAEPPLEPTEVIFGLSRRTLLDLESNRHLNPNLDPPVPVQSWRKSEDVRDLEGRLVKLQET